MSQAKIVARISLYKGGKWRQLLCTHCYASSSSRLWTCSCGLQWMGCGIHAPVGFACSCSRLARRRKPIRIEVDRCTNLVPPPTVEQTAPKRARAAESNSRRWQRAPSNSASFDAPPHNPESSKETGLAISTHDRGTKRCMQLTSEASSSSTGRARINPPGMLESALSSPSDVPSSRGTKRAASTNRNRMRPKPKARSNGANPIDAINRIRESRANPL